MNICSFCWEFWKRSFFSQNNFPKLFIALNKRSVVWRLKGFNSFKMLDILKHFHKLLIILFIQLNILQSQIAFFNRMLATESLIAFYLVPMTTCFFCLPCLFHVGFSQVSTGDFPGRIKVNCKLSCLMLVHIEIRKTKILSYPCDPPMLFIFVSLWCGTLDTVWNCENSLFLISHTKKKDSYRFPIFSFLIVIIMCVVCMLLK